MSERSLVGLIRGRWVRFLFYRDGALWYEVEGSAHLRFPVPVQDAGSGTFRDREKAITLMRWIRRHLDQLEEAADAKRRLV